MDRLIDSNIAEANRDIMTLKETSSLSDSFNTTNAVMKKRNRKNSQVSAAKAYNNTELIVTEISSHQYNGSSSSYDIASNQTVVMVFNKSFAERLLKLQCNAIQMQYYLACFNTLGGAYHLCDKPKVALIISQKQEVLARKIGSLPLLLRARGFQATNIGMIGYPNKATKFLNQLIKEAEKNNLEEIGHFLKANLVWMQQHLLSLKSTTSTRKQIQNNNNIDTTDSTIMNTRRADSEIDIPLHEVGIQKNLLATTNKNDYTLLTDE